MDKQIVTVSAQLGRLRRTEWCAWLAREQVVELPAVYVPDCPEIGGLLVSNPLFLGVRPMEWWEGDAARALAADFHPTRTIQLRVVLARRSARRRFEQAYALAGGFAREADRGRGVIDTTPLPEPAVVAPRADDDVWEFSDFVREDLPRAAEW